MTKHSRVEYDDNSVTRTADRGAVKPSGGTQAVLSETNFPNFQIILDALPYFVHVQWTDCRIIAVNKRFYDHLGNPAGRCIGQILRGQPTTCQECLIRKGMSASEEQPIECMGQSGRIYQIYGKPLAEDSIGKLVLVSTQDISTQRWSEEALCKVEERLRAIADYTCDWESWFGVEGNLVWVNPAVERITGYTVEECMNMSNYPLPIVHEEDRPALNQILIRFVSRPDRGEDHSFRIYHKEGMMRWISMSWQPVYSTKHDYLGIRSGMRDITLRKEAEEKEKREYTEYAVLRERLGFLTNREREVMSHVVMGKPNKLIAHELGVSPKTIEIHRSRVMEKLQVHSVAELVRFSIRAEMK